MNSPHPTLPLSGGWRIVPLLTMLGISAFISISWMMPEHRTSWDSLDLVVFRSLNNTLATGSTWRALWAFMNWRGFDVVGGVFILAVIVGAHREIGVRRWKYTIASVFLLACAILITRQFFSETLVDKTMRYHRPSPTQALDNTWRLSTLVPRIQAKDSSPWSFPGDHGFVLLSVALYVSMFRARRTARWTWLISIVLILPRLIAGAHWMTDILIGSGAMALVTISLLMATPVHDVFMRLLSGDYFEIREQPQVVALPYYEESTEEATHSDTASTNENEPLRRAA